MNRTILIVICDFLLVSLLAFSTVDINKVTDEGTERRVQVDIATNQTAESGKDLAAVMRVALEDERKHRDQLLGELTRARDTASEQERQSQALKKEIQSRELAALDLKKELQTREQVAQDLKNQLQSREQAARLMSEAQSNLQARLSSSQVDLDAVNRKLQASSVDALLSKEKLAALEAEAKKQTTETAELQKQLNNLAVSNQAVLGEKQKLAAQLQVAEVEKRHASEQVAKMSEQVKVEREEKAKLADGVKALASKSSELAKEVRENRPLTPNSIFNEFITNRVQARIQAARSGIFGLDASKKKDADIVLVTDGTNTYALGHVEDTPFALNSPGTEWEGIAGTLGANDAEAPIRSLSFHLHDPRIVLIPVGQAEVRKLGCKVYKVSADPYKFSDAVLVGAREGYFGECSFQIDLSTPDYVKLDRNLIKGLFGKFNPSRGDLVFSKTGELMGVMANSTYCMMLNNFTPTATFRFGQDVRDQHTGETLSRLYAVLQQMPSNLR